MSRHNIAAELRNGDFLTADKFLPIGSNTSGSSKQYLVNYGATMPAVAASGYAPGALFVDTTNKELAVNVGSATSAQFRSLEVLHIPNTAAWSPTDTEQYALEARIYSDGEDSDPANLTTCGAILIKNDGDSTGKADVDTDAVAFHFEDWTEASGTTNMLSDTPLAELPDNYGIRVKVNDTICYIPAVIATGWN